MVPIPIRRPWVLLAVLWLAALALAFARLGNVPLRDWDEAIVARVALELSQKPWPEVLLPTYLGDPYLNKPPGLHWLMAAGFDLWRRLGGAGIEALPPEWLVRLVPAALSSLIVPLVALIQLQLRPRNPLAAVCTAAIALTLLPLARGGRLAMLDGVQLCAMTALWLGLLMAGPQRRAAARGGLMAGMAGSVLLLLKAPVLLPVLATGLVLRWLDRDLACRAWRVVGLGLLVGLIPALIWHGWHLLQRGDGALIMWGHQGLVRITDTLEGHDGGPFLPLLEVLEGGWPWLPLWPLGLAQAWRQRRQPEGRWSLGLSLATALMVLPIQTQLPWYSVLLWPPFCLVCGPPLAGLLNASPRPRSVQGIAWFWCLLGTALVAISLLSLAGLVPVPPDLRAQRLLPLPAGLGLLGGGLLLCRSGARHRRGGLILLTAGWWFSLALLFRSPLWNWELNENWPVRPVAALALTAPSPSGPAAAAVYLRGEDGSRPSLHWYSQRKVQTLPDQASADLPARFVLIQREEDGPQPADQASIQLGNGAICRLDGPPQEPWQRWLCINPAAAGHGPP